MKCFQRRHFWKTSKQYDKYQFRNSIRVEQKNCNRLTKYLLSDCNLNPIVVTRVLRSALVEFLWICSSINLAILKIEAYVEDDPAVRTKTYLINLKPTFVRSDKNYARSINNYGRTNLFIFTFSMGNEVSAKLVDRSMIFKGFPARDNDARLLSSLKTCGNNEWRSLWSRCKWTRLPGPLPSSLLVCNVRRVVYDLTKCRQIFTLNTFGRRLSTVKQL